MCSYKKGEGTSNSCVGLIGKLKTNLEFEDDNIAVIRKVSGVKKKESETQKQIVEAWSKLGVEEKKINSIIRASAVKAEPETYTVPKGDLVPMFQCKFCQSKNKYIDIMSLKIHQNNECKDSPHFQCKICCKRYRTFRDVQIHMQYFHGLYGFSSECATHITSSAIKENSPVDPLSTGAIPKSLKKERINKKTCGPVIISVYSGDINTDNK